MMGQHAGILVVSAAGRIADHKIYSLSGKKKVLRHYASRRHKTKRHRERDGTHWQTSCTSHLDVFHRNVEGMVVFPSNQVNVGKATSGVPGRLIVEEASDV
jgi:hypothetical protein